MALNSITDIVNTVQVSKSEYEELIRESNTLRIIANFASNRKYIDVDTLKNIMGIESESGDEKNGSAE